MAKLKFEYNSTKQRYYADTDKGLFTTDINPAEVTGWKQLPPNADGRITFVPVSEIVEVDIPDELEISSVDSQVQELNIKLI
jgi:hypothetical protein